MRHSVSIDDELGRQVEEAAEAEGVSVSAFYARAAEERVKARRRREAGRKLLQRAGTIEFRGDMDESIREMRRDDPERA